MALDSPALYIEAALWLAFFMFALYQHSFYWNVTVWSFFGTRLYMKAVSFYTRPRWPFLAFDLASSSSLLAWLLVRCFIPLVLLVWCLFLTPLQLQYSPMDAWTQYTHHKPHEPYEVLYNTEQSFKADVFAIHGLGSDPASAWTYRGANGTSVQWLKDLLPYREGFGDIRVTMLNHQTRWDSHTAAMSFEGHAAKLLADIENIHEPGMPIIFISHSFGGLLLKKALILARHKSSEIATSTKSILFLGVPHGGTQAAYLASLLSCTAYWRGSSAALLEYMSPTRPAITELEEDFYNAYVKGSWRETRTRTLPYICDFIEMREEKIGKLSLAPTVGTKSAGSHRHGEIIYLDTDHRGLNKFSSASDPNFRDFCRQFKIAVGLATGEVERQHTRSKKTSALKAVSTIPFEKDRNFIGRKDVISQLDAIYSRKESHNRAALVGWGGIGKTQIAIEYSYRIRERNPNIWVFWLHAGQPDLFTQAYIEIGKNVNLSLDSTDSDTKNMQQIYEWLRSEVHEPWLMILDNADDVDLFYQNKSPESKNQGFINFLPRVPHGAILITSRDRMAAFDVIGAPDNNHNIVDVMMMNEEDALALLKSRLPESLFDEESAKELLSLLGYVPLAITQACAYISRTPAASITKYLTLVKHGNNKVLKNGIVDHRRYPGISDAIFTTWVISFEHIRKQRPSSAELLSLMSVLDRHGIPASLLISYRKIALQRTGLSNILSKLIRTISLKLLNNIEPQDQILALEAEVAEDLELLVGFSLIAIDTNDGTYLMHRLVQRATEDWLGDRHELHIWQNTAIKLLAAIYPRGYFDYKSCRQLQVHADRVLSYNTETHNLLLGQSRLLYQSAWYAHRYTRDHLDALRRVEKAIFIRKQVYTEPSPPMQECLDLKALCLIALGNLKEGEALLYKVARARVKVWGFAHSSTLDSLNHIGDILYYQRKFKEAEAVYRDILEVRKINWPHSDDTYRAWREMNMAIRSLLRNEFSHSTTLMRNLGDEELESLIIRQLQYENEQPGWLFELDMPVLRVASFLYQRGKFREVGAIFETLSPGSTFKTEIEEAVTRRFYHTSDFNYRRNLIMYPLIPAHDIEGMVVAEIMINALIEDANPTQAAWLWHSFLGEDTQTYHNRIIRNLNQTSTEIIKLLDLGVLNRMEYRARNVVLHQRLEFYDHYKSLPQFPDSLQRETKSNIARLAKVRIKELQAAIRYYELLKRGPEVSTAFGLYWDWNCKLDESSLFGSDYIYTIEDVELLEFISNSIQFLIIVQKYLSDTTSDEVSQMIETNRIDDVDDYLQQAIDLQKSLAFGGELNDPLSDLLYQRAINLHLRGKYQEAASILIQILVSVQETEKDLQATIEKDLKWTKAYISRKIYDKTLHSMEYLWENAPRGCEDSMETLLHSLRELLLIDPNLSSECAISSKYIFGYIYTLCNQHTKANPLLEEYIEIGDNDWLVWRTRKRCEAG